MLIDEEGLVNVDAAPVALVGLDCEHNRISIVGELDAYSAPAFVASFTEEFQALSGDCIEVDCSSLCFIDASGLSALIVVARHVRRRGYDFDVVSTGASLGRLLELCSLPSV